MAYIREKDIQKFVEAKEIPFSGCECPV